MPSPQVHFFQTLLADQTRRGIPLAQAVAGLRAISAGDAYVALDEAAANMARLAGQIGTLREPRTLRTPGGDAWYTGPSDADVMWPAYKEFLQKSPLTDTALKNIDISTTKIMSLLSPPGLGQIKTRGLVIGYVQSGKTANYTGLISKAADVGYRLFIVLTGMIEVLRQQTQERLESDLCQLRPERWITLTDTRDFRQQGRNVNAFLSEHAQQYTLAAVKKNARVLERLWNWLDGANEAVLRSCPVLIIDDEADQASVNTAEGDQRTKVNDAILKLLGRLPKAAYVGYTATPFANVLIDPSLPDDLYPRDFIVDLPMPDGYFGPERIFGRDPLELDQEDVDTDGLDIVRIVPEVDAKLVRPPSRSAEPFSPVIPDTLETALLYFWLATAARYARGQQGEHSTMLVHTTMRAQVHEDMRPLIEGAKHRALSGLQRRGGTLTQALRTLWQQEQAKVPSASLGETPVDFDQLEKYLRTVISKTGVYVENSFSNARLNYADPGQVVVVLGGNVLSRGLTLKGLTVSYFVRSTSTYDTLLQMGRWFGFRQGYNDLPRVWMTQELYDYFHIVATVERELRHDVMRYEDENLTPLDFQVRIRTHPMLEVTSPGKMRNAETVRRSYSGRRMQTLFFKRNDNDWLQDNIEAARALFRGAMSAGIQPRSAGSNRLFDNVDCQLVLDFLNSYAVHEKSRELRRDLVTKYIQRQVEKKEHLRSWNVAVVARAQVEQRLGAIDLGFGPIPMINRADYRASGAPPSPVADLKALMSHSDVVVDIPNLWQRASTDSHAYPLSEMIRDRSSSAPNTGLLVLYPVSRNSIPMTPRADSKRHRLEAVNDVLGMGLVFPEMADDSPEIYISAPAPDLPEAEVLEYRDED